MFLWSFQAEKYYVEWQVGKLIYLVIAIRKIDGYSLINTGKQFVM